jgi:hypothetical protein
MLAIQLINDFGPVVPAVVNVHSKIVVPQLVDDSMVQAPVLSKIGSLGKTLHCISSQLS